ncbi:hypothetical protein E1B28_001057 [Marasmius oreades]|uniref:Uncharacterized protein n=1 Tax=Marasmius oreades TaxID=181124 RepID=A0A9P7V2M9_9AGAR|nr:uncharacterized protein E1B28_001057 [Marasmius oreades]KAG7099188.1 hypothetical protein E1B28_001057 [Marasmius oreades]
MILIKIDTHMPNVEAVRRCDGCSGRKSSLEQQSCQQLQAENGYLRHNGSYHLCGMVQSPVPRIPPRDEKVSVILPGLKPTYGIINGVTPFDFEGRHRSEKATLLIAGVGVDTPGLSV